MKVGRVCLEAEVVRNHSSNPISAEAACEACCLPGGLHLDVSQQYINQKLRLLTTGAEPEKGDL